MFIRVIYICIHDTVRLKKREPTSAKGSGLARVGFTEVVIDCFQAES